MYFIEWLKKRLDKRVKNEQGGFEPSNDQEMNRYKNADLITLPKGVPGTNCGNCRFARKTESGATCGHDDLKGVEITPRMCCKFWDNEGVHRAWGDEQA